MYVKCISDKMPNIMPDRMSKKITPTTKVIYIIKVPCMIS